MNFYTQSLGFNKAIDAQKFAWMLLSKYSLTKGFSLVNNSVTKSQTLAY